MYAIRSYYEDFQNRRVFKPFKFVFDHIDTNDLNHKAYLPIFISETISDFFYRKDPQTTREYIRANQVSGVNNTSITQYLGGISQTLNIYDNYLVILDKNFVSPISDFGLSRITSYNVCYTKLLRSQMHFVKQVQM